MYAAHCDESISNTDADPPGVRCSACAFSLHQRLCSRARGHSIPQPGEEPAAASLRSARAQAHDSAVSLDEVAMWEEDRGVSRYAADLPQLPEGLGRWGRRVRPRQAATPGQPSLRARGCNAAAAGSAAAP